jgi:flagellar biosynthesis component FlhA
VAAVFAALLAALPGLPTVPFATLAVALGAGAFLRRRPGSVAEGRGPPPRGTALALVAHPGTAPRLRAFAPARGDTDALFQRLGVRWPVHRVEEDRGLPEDAVRIELAGAPEATVRVTEDLAPLADRLRELLPARPEALFGLQELRNELDRLGPEVPALLRAVIPERVDEAGLAALLRGLLREGVSVRPLREILEALAEGPPLPDGLEGRLVRLREGLSGPLTAPHVRDGRLLVHRVDPEVEEVLREATGPDGRLAAPPELLQELRQSASKALEEGGVLLCRGDVRPLLRDALLGRVPPAPVLAYGEVDARVEVTVGAPMRPGGV